MDVPHQVLQSEESITEMERILDGLVSTTSMQLTNTTTTTTTTTTSHATDHKVPMDDDELCVMPFTYPDQFSLDNLRRIGSVFVTLMSNDYSQIEFKEVYLVPRSWCLAGVLDLLQRLEMETQLTCEPNVGLFVALRRLLDPVDSQQYKRMPSIVSKEPLAALVWKAHRPGAWSTTRLSPDDHPTPETPWNLHYLFTIWYQ